MLSFAPDQAAILAKAIAAGCVRNTHLENIHAEEVLLDDENMRILMKEVVDRIYTVLLNLDDTKLQENLDFFLRFTAKWDEPELVESWVSDGTKE
ncbi:MAG: hypothetical protein AAFQ05_00990 [Pseudomonadota bacterium]